MKVPLSKIAMLVQGHVIGDSDKMISAAAPFEQAGADEITVAGSARFVKKIEDCNAAAILVSRDISHKGHNLVQVDNPHGGLCKGDAIFSSAGKTTGCDTPRCCHRKRL